MELYGLLDSDGETTQLPLVNADECFIKLKYGKVYTLEELGLC